MNTYFSFFKILLTYGTIIRKKQQKYSNAKGKGTWGKKRNLVSKIQLFEKK